MKITFFEKNMEGKLYWFISGIFLGLGMIVSILIFSTFLLFF